ncbi:MAG: leucine-rich repeat protein [Paludibacteraceae bacterium]|nr:leucine-rich repeat protein [Paludibacteraceae bacterium]
MNNLVRSLGLFLSCLSLSVAAAWGEVTSGKLDDCIWEYFPESQKLVLSGKGELSICKSGKLRDQEMSTAIFSCRNLEICAGVTAVSDSAFLFNQGRWGKYNLGENLIFYGSTVTSIGAMALWGAPFESLFLPPSVRTIGKFAFSESVFKFLYIPSGVTTIGEQAFGNCKSLEIIVDDRDAIDQDYNHRSMFKYCSSYIIVYVKNAAMKAWYEKLGFSPDRIRVTSGADSDFMWYNDMLMNKSRDKLILCRPTIANVTLLPTWTTIERDVFRGSVGKLEIPASIKTIDSWPLSASVIYASNVFSSNVEVPSALRSVKVYALNKEVKKCYENYGFTSVVVCDACGTNASCSLENGVLTIFGSGKVFDAPWLGKEDVRKSIKRVVVKSGITALSGGLFKDCENLASISLPEGVTSIGEGLFSGCTSLRTVTLPSTLEKMPNAFDNSNIQTLVVREGGYFSSKNDKGEEANIIFAESSGTLHYSLSPKFGSYVKTAGELCFASQTVSAFDIPATVTEIASNAFANLTISKIYCASEAEIPANAFSNTVKKKAKAYVASEAIQKNFLRVGFLEENVLVATGKCGDAYYYAENAKLTIFGDGNIAEPAKGWPNDKFTSITFVGNSFVGIQSGAFAKLPAISSEIAIPSSIHYIGAEAFGSEKIRRVSCDSQKPADLDPSAFKPAVYGAARLLVPQSAWDAYSNALGWEKFGSYTDPYSVYDVNKDGKVNAADVSMVKKNVK